jgi:hypothetical protein
MKALFSMKVVQGKVLALAALAAMPMLTGCMSQAALRQSVADREAEIRDLREERASLKGQVATLRTQLQGAEAAASEASLRASLDRVEAQIPASAPVQTARSFPELDGLGIGYGLRNGQMVISIPSEITASVSRSITTSAPARTSAKSDGKSLAASDSDTRIICLLMHFDCSGVSFGC